MVPRSSFDGPLAASGAAADRLEPGEPAAMARQLLDAQQRLLDLVSLQHRHLQQSLVEQQQALQACLAAGILANPATERHTATTPPMEQNGQNDVNSEASDTITRTASEYVSRLNREYTNTDDFDPKTPENTRKRPMASHVFLRTGPMSRLARTDRFNHVVGMFILLNVVFTCVQADWLARNPGRGRDQPVPFVLLETGFFLVFFFELLLRLIAYQRSFCCGEEWRWNLFDATIVAVAAVEEIFKLLSEKRMESSLTSLRTLRILKITRVIRVVRIVRMLRDVRIMFVSIMATVRMLCWSIVCVVLIMSPVAAYIATAASEYVGMEGEDPEVAEYFGSMFRTSISLFQAVTNGIDWRVLSDILGRASTVAQAMLFAYITVMVYVVVNILTGIVVTTANKAAEDDLEYTMHEELSRHQNVVATLNRILSGEDEHHSGFIQWSELQGHLDDPLVRGYFKRLDLEPWHLQALFDLFDPDKNGIKINQFIRACVRMRCQVKNIDMMAAVQDLDRHCNGGLREVHETLEKLERTVNAQMAHYSLRDKDVKEGTCAVAADPKSVLCAVAAESPKLFQL